MDGLPSLRPPPHHPRLSAFDFEGSLFSVGGVVAEINRECHVSLRHIGALCGLFASGGGQVVPRARACVNVERKLSGGPDTQPLRQLSSWMSGRRVGSLFARETGATERSTSFQRSPAAQEPGASPLLTTLGLFASSGTHS